MHSKLRALKVARLLGLFSLDFAILGLGDPSGIEDENPVALDTRPILRGLWGGEQVRIGPSGIGVGRTRFACGVRTGSLRDRAGNALGSSRGWLWDTAGNKAVSTLGHTWLMRRALEGNAR